MSPELALTTIENLANGVHPTTGEVLNHDDVLNDPQVIRALSLAAKIMRQTNSRAERKATRPINFGKPWTEVESTELLTRFDNKMSIKDIAAKHGRAHTAIAARLVRLGRVENRAEAWNL